MFYKVKMSERKEIAPLFKGIDDSMVIAYLQGYMGDAYIDRYPNPTVGVIISGEYSFFGGDPTTDFAKELVSALFSLNPGKESVAIFAGDNMGWKNTLLAVPENHPVSIPRFGIVQKDYEFDKDLLQSFVDGLPEGYTLKSFDEDLYDQAMSEDWAKEFCETFDSADEYLTKGFGYAVVHDGKLVAGCSTMTVYDGGTEIQIATHPDYRRKGLSMPVAGAFLLESMRRGIRPCWDAANETSLHMALKLGYEYKGEYTTIGMHISPERPIKVMPYWGGVGTQ